LSKRTRQVLAAAMIVKDEEATLARCLASLQGVVDEIHVHDTGSTDATPEIAAEFGAHVTRGPWTGDFAAARNAALEGWTADWVLSIDADEEAVSDPAQLREFLAASSAGVLHVDIDSDGNGHSTTIPGGRLFRPRWGHWSGRVHEQVVGRTKPLKAAVAPRAALRLLHAGYGSLDDLAYKKKVERNLAIAQADVDDLVAQGTTADPSAVARTLVDLGRSQMGAGRMQDAVDTFETVRELFPGTRAWMRATGALAKLLFAAGMADACLFLAEQLREAGADANYCDWLSAHALHQLGATEAARRMHAGITTFVDTEGIRTETIAHRDARDLAAQRSAHARAA
jgi:hypothetical protein